MDELEAKIQQLLANANESAAGGQLTLKQLKEVIKVGGCAAGLAVQMEYPVRVPMFNQNLPGRLDCVWKQPSDGDIIVAWEIDGINVERRHVFGHERQPLPPTRNAVGIIRKLSRTNAPIKVHALYSYRNGLLKRPDPQRVQQWHNEQDMVAPQNVLVQTDRQLLDGTLMHIVAQARSLRAASVTRLPKV